MAESRRYPSCCTSAYCGNISTDAACISCPDRKYLDEFKNWIARTKATCPDPIWRPLYYVAGEVQ